jgi:hypothetical protein
VPEGETGSSFHDRIPIPLGRYSVTLRVPESPQIAPVTLNGRCDPARGSIEYLNEAIATFNSTILKWGRQRGDSLIDVADRQNLAGRWSDALRSATEAVSLVPEYSDEASKPIPAPGGERGWYRGKHYRNKAVQAQATAEYHLGNTQNFLSHMRWLWEYEAKLAQTRDLKSSYCTAGSHMHFAAKRLLRMGVHPDQVKPLIEQGNQYYRMGGVKVPPKTPWFPD